MFDFSNNVVTRVINDSLFLPFMLSYTRSSLSIWYIQSHVRLLAHSYDWHFCWCLTVFFSQTKNKKKPTGSWFRQNTEITCRTVFPGLIYVEFLCRFTRNFFYTIDLVYTHTHNQWTVPLLLYGHLMQLHFTLL